VLGETVDHARRIVGLASSKGIGLRVAGSIAIVMRSPLRLEERNQKDWTPGDLDFVCARKEAPKLQEFFEELGFENDPRLLVATEGARWTLRSPEFPQAVDVFFDELEFCHRIDLRDRITLDKETLTVADLLLSKFQYVVPRNEDLDDIIALMKTFALGSSDDEMINVGRICNVLSRSWGFYYTAQLNRERVSHRLESASKANVASSMLARKRLVELWKLVENEPKGIGWQIRSVIGSKFKWYNDVDEAETF